MLPDQYRITRQDLKDAWHARRPSCAEGDCPDPQWPHEVRRTPAYMAKTAGLGLTLPPLSGRGGGAMIVGRGTTRAWETFPGSGTMTMCRCTATILAQKGAPIIELAALDGLSRDQVHEFAFTGGLLKIRGGDAPRRCARSLSPAR